MVGVGDCLIFFTNKTVMNIQRHGHIFYNVLTMFIQIQTNHKIRHVCKINNVYTNVKMKL